MLLLQARAYMNDIIDDVRYIKYIIMIVIRFNM